MNRIFTTWMMPCVLRFTSSMRHSMDEVTFGTSRWSDRCARQTIQMLAPAFSVDGMWPERSAEPVLPTPTDVPVSEPFDVPVPEPIDIPPPDPHDVPPPPMRPEFDPKPRSVP